MLNPPECCTRGALLRECHVFVSEMGISESSFGLAAVKDGSFMARLRAGKDINTKKLDDVRRHMAHERTRRAEAGARRSTACQEGPCLSEAEAEDCEAALKRSPSWRARFRAWFKG